jgi:hypothetical protein
MGERRIIRSLERRRLGGFAVGMPSDRGATARHEWGCQSSLPDARSVSSTSPQKWYVSPGGPHHPIGRGSATRTSRHACTNARARGRAAQRTARRPSQLPKELLNRSPTAVSLWSQMAAI